MVFGMSMKTLPMAVRLSASYANSVMGLNHSRMLIPGLNLPTKISLILAQVITMALLGKPANALVVSKVP